MWFQPSENLANSLRYAVLQAKPKKPQSAPKFPGEFVNRSLAVKVRDGPNTTTTIIWSPKSFASDATSKRHLIAHQMKHLCVFSVFHYVEWCGWKMGPHRMKSEMVVVVFGSSLNMRYWEFAHNRRLGLRATNNRGPIDLDRRPCKSWQQQ